MFYRNAKLPSNQDLISITNGQSTLNKLHINILINESSDALNFYYSQKLESWQMQFNNKLMDLRITYVFIMYYFNNGIPDENWIKPGRDGGAEYFPDFNENDFANKAMFDYYAEIFYYKFFSVWDSIFELINLYYRFEIKQAIRFNIDVKKKLGETNKNLSKYFNSIAKSIDKSKKYRNNFAHNFPPTCLNTDPSIHKTADTIVITGKWGEYIKSYEFVDNINELILILEKCLRRLENEFSFTKVHET